MKDGAVAERVRRGGTPCCKMCVRFADQSMMASSTMMICGPLGQDRYAVLLLTRAEWDGRIEQRSWTGRELLSAAKMPTQ